MSDVQSILAKILAEDTPPDERYAFLGGYADNLLDSTKCDKIEPLIGQYGWEPICEYLINVLRDDNQEENWPTATLVFWGAEGDKRNIPADELIALLYHRFQTTEHEGLDNLVWSLTSHLKGVGYLSEYDPLKDPKVLEHFRKLRGEPSEG
jgi:hypothetical protein